MDAREILRDLNEDHNIRFGLLKTAPETFTESDLEAAFAEVMAEEALLERA